MTARRSSFPLAAVVLVCSLSPAAPPDGKEPAKEGKAVGKPVLVPVWKKTTIGLPKEDYFDPKETEDARKWLTALYDRIITDCRSRSTPLMPPGVPSVGKSVVLYANDESIVARSLATQQEFKWDPGDLLWEMDRWFGLLQLAHGSWSRPVLDSWLKPDGDSPPCDRVLHRTLAYAFSTSEKRACFVDDIGIVPPVRTKGATAIGKYRAIPGSVRQSLLCDVNTETGKLVHRAGEPNAEWVVSDIFFVSAPLSDDASACVIKEQDRSVQLLRLDWKRHHEAYYPREIKGNAERALAAGRVWEADLAKAPTGLRDDPHRRIHAIHLIQAGDLVLCPTHLGRVVAVEAKTGKVRWTHEYAPLDAKRFPTFAPEWVVVPPVVVGDRYVYAPADFPDLLCLNVADGKKAWGAKKGDGLYPAVVGEQVLVVGEKTVRALDLKDGTEKWKLDLPGLPCGRGAVLGGHYLVPVSELTTWRGMVAMVDVKNGKITEVIKSDKDEPVGNLVVHQDFLVSQTLTEIAVFPIKKN